MSSFGTKVKEFFGFYESEETTPMPLPEAPKPQIKVAKQVPSRTPGFHEIKVEEPRIYEDSLNIASFLRENKPVIVNLKYLDSDSGKRLIDFICGTAYAINGHMMKIGEHIFLFTPNTVLISDSGEKSQLQEGLQNAEKEAFFSQVTVE